MYGYTLEQLIKEKGENIVGGSSNPNIEKVIEAFFKNPKPVNYESFHTSRAGEQVWAQTTLSPIFDRNGNLINVVAIDSDITRIKQSEIRIKLQNEEIASQSQKILEQSKELEQAVADEANRGKIDFLALAPIPIVAMTADSMKGDREKCIEAGMDDYISKPVKKERIFEVIEERVRPGR
jgi:PAS domain S-box-containing protein